MKARKKGKGQRRTKIPCRRYGPFLVGGFVLGSTMAVGQDLHLLPVTNDSDGDLLKDGEERSFFYNPDVADQNANSVIDGIDLAEDLASQINALETYGLGYEGDLPTTYTYRIDCLALGLENCSICGQEVNMGFTEIVNPVLNCKAYVPFIGLHFMEHGSFSYEGTENEGRVDILRLLSVFEEHPTPVAHDTDGDLMTDDEEAAISSPPAEPDWNGNNLPDGMDHARKIAGTIRDLEDWTSGGVYPTDRIYKILYLADGLETCPVCGEVIEMGHAHIVNPMKSKEMDVSFLMLHFLEHASFRSGVDRVDVPEITDILDLDFSGLHNWDKY